MRTRGGNKKYRALRLEMGNYAWGSEGQFGAPLPFSAPPPPVRRPPKRTAGWPRDRKMTLVGGALRVRLNGE